VGADRRALPLPVAGKRPQSGIQRKLAPRGAHGVRWLDNAILSLAHRQPAAGQGGRGADQSRDLVRRTVRFDRAAARPGRPRPPSAPRKIDPAALGATASGRSSAL